jgi:Reverse transcriptase (RNA-dependent DNA polymerase)
VESHKEGAPPFSLRKGPLLFLLYVNELPLWIKNNMRMFADDTKVWCRIKETGDGKSLQNDLDKLADWSDKWLLRFNPEKCKIMHIGHELDTHYFMKRPTGPTKLLIIKEEKDLGVFVRSDLKASNHCIKSTAKARRIIGMVRRNFRRLDEEDFLLL